MFAFRCTRKLIQWLDSAVEPEPPPPTNLLGDWYANMFFTKHHRLIMLVSERTLLPVLMPIRERKNLRLNFKERLEELLLNLGVSEFDVKAELQRMERAVIAKTASRSVLGSMNDFSQMAREYIDRHDAVNLLDLEIWLADTPCSPIGRPGGYGYPDKETLRL